MLSYISFELPVIIGFSFLLVTGSSFSSDLKSLFNPWYYFSTALTCLFNSLPDGKYSNLLIAAAFCNKSFSDKTSLPVKNLYLLTFLIDTAEALAVCLSKSYWALIYSVLLLITLIFTLIIDFYNKFFPNLNGLSDEKVVSFIKIEYGSLINPHKFH